jgi:hypothetical protein
MQTAKRYGIVIGVNDYSQVAPGNNLRYTSPDAQRIYLSLCGRAGFATDCLQLLCDTPKPELKDVAKSPSRSNILACVNEIARKAGPDDLVLIYFAGHGGEIGGNPYLLTNDTRMDVVKDTAVDVGLLNNYLQESKAGCIVRFFDACRVPVGDTRAFAQGMSRGLEDAILKHAKGRGTFNSCSSGEYSFERPDLEHGVFTYFLCEGLDGKAADEHGIVRWDPLVDYVKTSIAAFCKQQSRIQTPHAISDFSGSLELARTEIAKPAPATRERHDTPPALLGVIDRHVAGLPAHVRDFTLTTDGEILQFYNSLVGPAKNWATVLKAPGLDVSVEAKPGQRGFDGDGSFAQDIATSGFNNEFTGQTHVIEVKLTPSQIVIPSSRLVLVAARFHFFYWLWFLHQCIKTRAHTAWQPDPLMTRGFFTFKPSGIRKPEKIQETLDTILARVTEDMDKWAQQSRQYFEARIEPLKKASNIIS